MQGRTRSAFASFFLIYFLFCFATLAAASQRMSIVGLPPDPHQEAMIGNGWVIFLDGPISVADAKRFEQPPACLAGYCASAMIGLETKMNNSAQGVTLQLNSIDVMFENGSGLI